MNIQRRRRWLVMSAIAFFIITPIVLLYTSGYRLSSDLALTKTGGIYIYSPISGSEIFLNNKLRKTTNILQNGIFIQSLKPDTYSILVAKEGYWPWQKNLPVKNQLVTEARAFLIPQTPTGNTLIRGPIISMHGANDQNLLLMEEMKEDGSKKIIFYLPENNEFLTDDSNKTGVILSSYDTVEDVVFSPKIVYIKTPSGIIVASIDFSNGIISATLDKTDLYQNMFEKSLDTEKEFADIPNWLVKYDGHDKAVVWYDAETNNVWAKWLKPDLMLPYYFSDEKMSVAQPSHAVKNIDFFPGRSDVIIFASGNGIFASELDGRDKRIVQPIYKGKDPLFAVSSSQKYIYVLDAGVLLKIEL